jgi:hypothetical protein
MISFAVGQKVKFNEVGLKNYTGGTKKLMEKCREWRFIVEGFSNEKDRFNNHCVLLTRVDDLPKRKVLKNEVWTPTYFELVEELKKK